MICSKCGKEFEGGFCPWCGAASEESEKASAADKIAEEETPKAETSKAETPKAEVEKKIAEQAANEEKAEEKIIEQNVLQKSWSVLGVVNEKIKCPKCGNEFSGKFCSECGYRAVELDNCPVCGAKYKEGDKFCTECGYSYNKQPNAAANTVAGIGTVIKNSYKKICAFCKKHRKRVTALAVAVVLILVIVVPISAVFTSPVNSANVNRINIGDTWERVLRVLGEPYLWRSESEIYYFSGNYIDVYDQLKDISNDDVKYPDYIKMEYKSTKITFDSDGKVLSVAYNAKIVNGKSSAKNIVSTESNDSITQEKTYTVKYSDGSLYKGKIKYYNFGNYYW